MTSKNNSLPSFKYQRKVNFFLKKNFFSLKPHMSTPSRTKLKKAFEEEGIVLLDKEPTKKWLEKYIREKRGSSEGLSGLLKSELMDMAEEEGLNYVVAKSNTTAYDEYVDRFGEYQNDLSTTPPQQTSRPPLKIKNVEKFSKLLTETIAKSIEETGVASIDPKVIQEYTDEDDDSDDEGVYNPAGYPPQVEYEENQKKQQEENQKEQQEENQKEQDEEEDKFYSDDENDEEDDKSGEQQAPVQQAPVEQAPVEQAPVQQSTSYLSSLSNIGSNIGSKVSSSIFGSKAAQQPQSQQQKELEKKKEELEDLNEIQKKLEESKQSTQQPAQQLPKAKGKGKGKGAGKQLVQQQTQQPVQQQPTQQQPVQQQQKAPEAQKKYFWKNDGAKTLLWTAASGFDEFKEHFNKNSVEVGRVYYGVFSYVGDVIYVLKNDCIQERENSFLKKLGNDELKCRANYQTTWFQKNPFGYIKNPKCLDLGKCAIITNQWKELDAQKWNVNCNLELGFGGEAKFPFDFGCVEKIYVPKYKKSEVPNNISKEISDKIEYYGPDDFEKTYSIIIGGNGVPNEIKEKFPAKKGSENLIDYVNVNYSKELASILTEKYKKPKAQRKNFFSLRNFEVGLYGYGNQVASLVLSPEAYNDIIVSYYNLIFGKKPNLPQIEKRSKIWEKY